MPFVSLTRLRVRSLRFMPHFLVLAFRTTRQAQGSPGFRGGSLLPDRRRTFWTMTAWDGQAEMRAYMTAGSHRAAMPKLLDWCDEASVAHWEQEASTLPSWTEAEARMRAQGRASKVRRPSPDHAALAFAPARVTGAAPLPPRPGRAI